MDDFDGVASSDELAVRPAKRTAVSLFELEKPLKRLAFGFLSSSVEWVDTWVHANFSKQRILPEQASLDLTGPIYNPNRGPLVSSLSLGTESHSPNPLPEQSNDMYCSLEEQGFKYFARTPSVGFDVSMMEGLSLDDDSVFMDDIIDMSPLSSPGASPLCVKYKPMTDSSSSSANYLPSSAFDYFATAEMPGNLLSFDAIIPEEQGDSEIADYVVGEGEHKEESL